MSVWFWMFPNVNFLLSYVVTAPRVQPKSILFQVQVYTHQVSHYKTNTVLSYYSIYA